MVHLTLKSANVKTGPIPVSTSAAETCPTICGQYETCYGKFGPLGLHWNKVSAGESGMSWLDFTAAIAALPVGQLWRHNQAGDLPGVDQVIDTDALRLLVHANKGRKGFTYTHKPVGAGYDWNAVAVRWSNRHGFTVNLSADTIAQADELKSYGIAPVVVVVPEDTDAFTTPAGHKAIICPAQTHDNVSCDTCRLCQWADRDVIIAFRAHGTKKREITEAKVFTILK